MTMPNANIVGAGLLDLDSLLPCWSSIAPLPHLPRYYPAGHPTNTRDTKPVSNAPRPIQQRAGNNPRLPYPPAPVVLQIAGLTELDG